MHLGGGCHRGGRAARSQCPSGRVAPGDCSIKVTDALGNNVSASRLLAVSMSAVGSNGNLVPQSAPGNWNPGNPFTFDPTTGTYQFNLKTKRYKLGA